MGINMYLSEVKEQASYANTLAIAYKGYAQELNNSIDFFTNTSLTGKAYQSEKDYFNMIYKPLLRGLNLVCNYLIDAHYYFTTNYTSTVWSSDLEEDQLLHQIELTKQQIQYLDELCTKMPYLEIGFRYNIQVLYSLQVYFEQILSRFGDFNDTSPSLFANVETMLEQVEKGISVIESNAGWDPIMQKYDLSKIDMSWSLAIDTLAKANGTSLSIPESELQKEGEELQKELEKRTHTMVDIAGYRQWMWLLDPPTVTQEDLLFNERYEAWLDAMVEMYGREAIHGEQEIDPLTRAAYELREGVDYDTGRELSNIEKMQRVSMLCSYGMAFGLLLGYASNSTSTEVDSSQKPSYGEYADDLIKGRTKMTFNGKEVYIDNNLFDPNYVDDLTGLTNQELMAKGRPPIGIDGKPIIIHHLDQTNNGPVMEIKKTQHQQHYSDLHDNTGQSPSLINRNEFNKWRQNYWKDRVNNLK